MTLLLALLGGINNLNFFCFHLNKGSQEAIKIDILPSLTPTNSPCGSDILSSAADNLLYQQQALLTW